MRIGCKRILYWKIFIILVLFPQGLHSQTTDTLYVVSAPEAQIAPVDSNLYRKLTYLDSCLALDYNLSYSEKADLLCQKASVCEEMHYYTTAIHLYDQALELLGDNPENTQKRLDILLNQSILYEGYSDFGEAIKKLLHILKIARNEYPLERISAYINLAHYHSLTQNLVLSMEYIDSATKIIQRTDWKSADEKDEYYFKLHNITSGVWSKIDIDSAFKYLHLAESYAHRDIKKLTVLYQNFATLYLMKKDFSTAEDYFKKAQVLVDEPLKKTYLKFNMAEMALLQGNLDVALERYQDVLNEKTDYPAYHVRTYALEAMANIYAKKGDFKKAYELMTLSRQTADSSMVDENQKQILSLQRDFEQYKLENARKIFEYKEKVGTLQLFRKNMIITISAFGMLLCFALLFITIRKLNRQKKFSEHLSRKIKRILSEEHKLVQDLKDETDKQSRELVTNAIIKAKTNDLVNEILPRIDQLKSQSRDKNFQESLQVIQDKLKNLLSEDKQWNDFILYFEKVHPSFFNLLHKDFPNLTAGENRICAFIIMQLNTKEIAALTNRSVRTIDTIKFRIRKKMDIPSDISTLTFLQKYTQSEE